MEIFVINLKQERERRLSMEYQAEKFDLRFNYLEAVTPSQIELEYHSLVDWDVARGRNHLTDTEIACSLSHALAYRKIRGKGLDSAIILEDDAVLTPEFADFVKKGLRPSNFGADLIMFDYRDAVVNSWSSNEIFPNYFLYSVLTTPPGAAAYCVERKALDLLIEKTSRIRTEADWPIKLTNTASKLIYPRIVHHPSDDNDTTIGLERGYQKKSYEDYHYEGFLRLKVLKFFRLKYYLKKFFGQEIEIEQSVFPILEDKDVKKYILEHSHDE